MPKDTTGTHTPESVEIVASRLDAILSSLRVSKAKMQSQPPLTAIKVLKQNQLDLGLNGMTTWADSLRDAVDAARLELATKSVSDSHGKANKPSKAK